MVRSPSAGQGSPLEDRKVESRSLRQQGPGVPGRESAVGHKTGAAQPWQEAGAALIIRAPAARLEPGGPQTLTTEMCSQSRRIPTATGKGPREGLGASQTRSKPELCHPHMTFHSTRDFLQLFKIVCWALALVLSPC